MLKGLKKAISNNLLNVPGWKTNRRFVVIESDDWGSIRMPSREVYDDCLKNDYRVDLSPYAKFDALEDEKDLTALFDVLSKHKGVNGFPAIITANTVVANPDFEKIRNSNFTEYHYELFTDTFKNSAHHVNCFDLYAQGMSNNVFRPQFHAREHINVKRWMKALQQQQPDVLFAFNHDMAGLFPKSAKGGNRYVVALDYDDVNDPEEKMLILKDGLDIFEKAFNFRSSSFIAPNYVWDTKYEPDLFKAGIKYLQGVTYQWEPDQSKKRNKIYHFTGQKNNRGQIYLVRNCFFEPSLLPNKKQVVNECLERINVAFRWKKPAIIGSHRLNYIGSIHENNRTENLNLLNELLAGIVKRWPDVEFVSSDMLGDIIKKDYENRN
jgi:hypothetical protein